MALLLTITLALLFTVMHGADGASGFQAGKYVNVFSTENLEICPAAISFSSTADTVRAAQISQDGEACTGGNITITSSETSEISEIPGLAFRMRGEVSSNGGGDILCPSINMTVGQSFTVLKFKENIPIADLTSFVFGSSLPDGFSRFETDVDYLLLSVDTASCLMAREGSAVEPSNNDECFPAAATVLLADGSRKTMEDVRIGDRVQVGVNEFSRVFAWTHQHAHINADFIRIEHAKGTAPFVVTRNHFVHKIGSGLVLAKELAVGDLLMSGKGEHSRITSIASKEGRGLFNPQTMHGDIVVDGVLASTYTLAVSPGAAHALLTPIRACFNLFQGSSS